MTTSWNEIRQTENYLLMKMSPEESLVFEAHLLTNPWLRWNVMAQKKIYSLLRMYHRKKLKQEAEAVHHRVFESPEKAAFRKEINQLFNP